MTGDSKLSDRPEFWGWVIVAVGIYPILIALGVVSVEPGSIYDPMWVLFLVGMMFIIAGCMLIMRLKSKYNNLLAGLILLMFSIIGFWIAFFGHPDSFSGGIPFVSQTFNNTLARSLFGVGAVISFAMCMIAFRMHFKRI